VKRKRIVKEIVDTEQAYLENMKLVIDVSVFYYFMSFDNPLISTSPAIRATFEYRKRYLHR
jgi:hypothetical protein